MTTVTESQIAFWQSFLQVSRFSVLQHDFPDVTVQIVQPDIPPDHLVGAYARVLELAKQYGGTNG